VQAATMQKQSKIKSNCKLLGFNKHCSHNPVEPNHYMAQVKSKQVQQPDEKV